MARIVADQLIEGLTFDDVLLRPGRSEVLPADADVRTRLTRSVALNLPIIASAMDTVTEAAHGHRHGAERRPRRHSPQPRAARSRPSRSGSVKKYESGMVMNPITIHPDETLADALDD